MNGSDAFERTLKDAMESYELPYNSADWAHLERELDKKNGSGKYSSLGLLALLLGGAAAVAITIFLLVRPEANIGLGTPTDGQASIDPSQAAAADQSSGLWETPRLSAIVPEEGNVKSLAAVTPKKVVLETEKVAATTGKADGAPPPTPPAPTNTSIGILPSVTEGCPGTAVEFAASNLPSDGTFLWNFGDGSFSREPRPQHMFSKAGRFEVMLSHSSVAGGTIQNKPVSDVIVIHERPEAVFNFLKQEYENTVPSVHFENRSIGGQSYSWDFGDGSTSDISHPSHVFKKKGTYTVSLTVTNAGGCTDRVEKVIRIENDYDLLAARTFSPNADGVEDTFLPEALKTLGVRFHMSIHDPVTGQLLFESSDPQRPWNGRVGGRGEPCQTGDYVWMVEMKDGDKLGGTYNGTVSLLR